MLLLGSSWVMATEPDRRARTPRHVAEQLAKVYGHKLDQVAYIPALPLVAKLRLSDLTGDATHREEVTRIVAPFLSGEKSPVPKSGSEQAGHLIFAEPPARGGKIATADRACGAATIRPEEGNRSRSCCFITK
jgi:hypothetical protein